MKSKFSIDLADEWVESHPDEFNIIDDIITNGKITAATTKEELEFWLDDRAGIVFDRFPKYTQDELLEEWDGDMSNIKKFLELVSFYHIQGFLDESKLPS